MNNEKSFLTVFINFLVLKRTQKPKYFLKYSNRKSNTGLKMIVQKFFNILSKFGYKISKRLSLKNISILLKKDDKNIGMGMIGELTKELNEIEFF